MHKLKELKIWNKAIDLCVDVYDATTGFPREEIYGLTSQIRKASVSISSNIAEGAGRNSNNEFAQFLGIATGSAYELQTQITIAQRLRLMNDQKANYLMNNIDELLKMIYSFKISIKNQAKK